MSVYGRHMLRWEKKVFFSIRPDTFCTLAAGWLGEGVYDQEPSIMFQLLTCMTLFFNIFFFDPFIVGASQVKWNRVNRHVLATSHDGDVRIWDLRVGIKSDWGSILVNYHAIEI